VRARRGIQPRATKLVQRSGTARRRAPPRSRSRSREHTGTVPVSAAGTRESAQSQSSASATREARPHDALAIVTAAGLQRARIVIFGEFRVNSGPGNGRGRHVYPGMDHHEPAFRQLDRVRCSPRPSAKPMNRRRKQERRSRREAEAASFPVSGPCPRDG
jgi:hypothetical protein